MLSCLKLNCREDLYHGECKVLNITWGYHWIFSSFSWGIFGQMMHLLRPTIREREQNISWIKSYSILRNEGYSPVTLHYFPSNNF